MKKILVTVAHPDDEVLGFGGAGAAAASAGDEVTACILVGGVAARVGRPTDDQLTSDTLQAQRVMGFNVPILGDFPNLSLGTIPLSQMVAFIEEAIVRTGATRVVTHHPADMNDDHGVVAHATLAAARLYQRRSGIAPLESIHYMEVLSSTEWAFPDERLPFRPDTFVDTTETHELKLRALACYRGVMRPAPHPRSSEVITALSVFRGSQAGLHRAEAFQTAFRRGL